MDAYLPPASPAQIAELTAQLVPTHRAIVLSHWGEFFEFLPIVLHLGVPRLLLTLGLSARMRERAAQAGRLPLLVKPAAWEMKLQQRIAEMRAFQRIARMRVFREWDFSLVPTALLYALGYALIYRLVRLPFNYAVYRLETSYGLKHISAMSWLQTSGEQWLNGVAVNTLGAVLLLGLIRISPRRWSSIAALLCACAGLITLRMPPSPSPDISSLPGGSHLAQRLHVLTVKAGLPNTKIFVDGSSDGKSDLNGSAGYSGTTPIITLNSKLVDTEPEAQIETTLAHELGHCVYQDDLWMLLPTAVGVFGAFPLIHWLAERLLKRFGRKWGVYSLGDPAALPLLLLCLHLVTLLTNPLANSYSRAVERRADAYALALTRDRLPMARQFAGFSQDSGFDAAPPDWFVFWFWDHPSHSERLQFALRGQPDSIGRHFAKFWR